MEREEEGAEPLMPIIMQLHHKILLKIVNLFKTTTVGLCLSHLALNLKLSSPKLLFIRSRVSPATHFLLMTHFRAVEKARDLLL